MTAHTTESGGDTTPKTYAAFIAYEREEAGALATHLRRDLQRFRRPPLRPRSMRVFQDRSNLSARGDWREAVGEALRRSEFLVVIATPSAVGESARVEDEIGLFLADGKLRNVLLVLADGSLPWIEESRGDSALPRNLAAAYAASGVEPQVVDMRRWRAKIARDSRPLYWDAIATIAAAVLGRDKDELFGEHVTMQRRTIVAAATAFVAIVTLAAFGALQWAGHQEAVRDRLRAEADVQTARADLAEGDLRRERAESLAAEARRAEQREHARGLKSLATAAQESGDPDRSLALLALAREVDSDEVELSAIVEARTRALREVWVTPVPFRGLIDRNVLSGDGRRCVGPTPEGLGVWDVSTGQLVAEISLGTESAERFAIDEDGRHVAYSSDRRLTRWAVDDGARESVEAPATVGLLTMLRDGDSVAVTLDGRVHTWSRKDGVATWSTDLGEATPVEMVVDAERGVLVAIATDEEVLELEPVERVIRRVATGSRRPSAGGAVRLSRDGALAAFVVSTGGAEERQEVRLYDVRRAAEGPSFEVEWGFGPLAISPDGRLLASTDPHGSLVLWDTESGERIARHENVGGRVGVEDLEFVDERIVAVTVRSLPRKNPFTPFPSVDDDDVASGSILLVDALDGERVRTFDGHDQRIRAVALQPQASFAASGGDDGVVRLWSSASGRLVARFDCGAPVSGLAFSCDGEQLVSADRAGRIRAWSVEDRELLHELDTALGAIGALALHPNGRHVAVASAEAPPLDGQRDPTYQPSIRVLSLSDGSSVSPVLRLDLVDATHLEFRPDGSALAGSALSVTRVWSTADWTESGTYSALTAMATAPDMRAVVGQCAFLSDGDVLAIGLGSGGLALAPADLKAPPEVRPAHDEPVACVATSVDGEWIATGSGPSPWEPAKSASTIGSVRFWRAGDRRPTMEIGGFVGGVDGISMSSDGAFALVAGADRRVRLIQVRRGEIEWEARESFNDFIVAQHPQADLLVAQPFGDTSWMEVRRISTGHVLGRLAVDALGGTPMVEFNLDGTRLLVERSEFFGNQSLEVWNTDPVEKLARIGSFDPLSDFATFGLSVSRVEVFDDQSFTTFDADTGERLFTTSVPDHGYVVGRGGETRVLAPAASGVELRDREGKLVTAWRDAPSDLVGVTLSRDLAVVVAESVAQGFWIASTADGSARRLTVLEPPEAVFVPDDRTLVLAQAGGVIELIDLDSATRMARISTGSESALTFYPSERSDGLWIGTAELSLAFVDLARVRRDFERLRSLEHSELVEWALVRTCLVRDERRVLVDRDAPDARWDWGDSTHGLAVAPRPEEDPSDVTRLAVRALLEEERAELLVDLARCATEHVARFEGFVAEDGHVDQAAWWDARLEGDERSLTEVQRIGRDVKRAVFERRFDEAHGLALELLALDKRSFVARWALANVAFRRGDARAARDHATLALEHADPGVADWDPTLTPPMRYVRAVSSRQLGDLWTAEEEFRELDRRSQLDARSWDAWFWTEERLGHYGRAAEVARRAKLAVPDAPVSFEQYLEHALLLERLAGESPLLPALVVLGAPEGAQTSLERGDVLLSIGGSSYEAPHHGFELLRQLSLLQLHETRQVVVLRDGDRTELELGPRDTNVQLAELTCPRIPFLLWFEEPSEPLVDAGVRVGDVLLSLDGYPIRGFDEFADYSPSDVVPIRIGRFLAAEEYPGYDAAAPVEWDGHRYALPRHDIVLESTVEVSQLASGLGRSTMARHRPLEHVRSLDSDDVPSHSAVDPIEASSESNAAGAEDDSGSSEPPVSPTPGVPREWIDELAEPMFEIGRGGVVTFERDAVDADLVALVSVAEHGHIRELHLERTRITDDGLALLPPLPALAVLNLSRTAITDDGVVRLDRFPSLLTVDLAETKVRGACAEELARLHNLGVVDASETNVGAEFVALLAALPHLRRLDLSGTRVDDATFEGLEGFAALEELHLDDTYVRGHELAFLSGGRLSELSVAKAQVDDAGLGAIARISTLRFLDIWGNEVTDDGLGHLARLVHLEELSIGSNPLSGAGLASLAGASKLESIDLHNSVLRGASGIGALTSLRELVLSRTRVDAESLRAVGRLEKLERLDLSNASLPLEEGLPRVEGLRSLEELDLANTGLNGENLRAILHDLMLLTRLDLSTNPVDDGELAWVSRLRSLEELILSGTNVRGAGLCHLAELQYLERLEIAHVDLNKQELERCLPELGRVESIELENVGFSDEQRSELNDRFPNLWISVW